MSSSTTFIQRHKQLVMQAEDLASAARREVRSIKPGENDGRRSVHALAARRKLMEMSKVIASVERLAQQNLRAGEYVMRKRVDDDLAALHIHQRDALNEVTAVTSGSTPLRTARGEETGETRQMTNRDLVQAQLAGIAKQEAALDRVEQSVSRVQNQATAIEGEVRSQVRIVETLDYDVEGVQRRVGTVRGRVEDYLRKMDRKLFYLTCFLVPFMLSLTFVLIIKFIL